MTNMPTITNIPTNEIIKNMNNNVEMDKIKDEYLSMLEMIDNNFKDCELFINK